MSRTQTVKYIVNYCVSQSLRDVERGALSTPRRVIRGVARNDASVATEHQTPFRCTSNRMTQACCMSPHTILDSPAAPRSHSPLISLVRTFWPTGILLQRLL